MKVLHIAAECFPAAKVGGLGDVVGALPKYLNRIGIATGVVLPKYGNSWLWKQQYKAIHRGQVSINGYKANYIIEQEISDVLGFTLFVIRMPDYFDRPGIYNDTQTGYGYADSMDRWSAFQQAALQWIMSLGEKPDIIHCHDHHTALIPFMVKYCPEFDALKYIPTIITIHNGVYQGVYPWSNYVKLPMFYSDSRNILDWNGLINCLAAGIKCAWQVTTVSHNYMEELSLSSNGLEPLIRAEWSKCRGILNGIDSETWDPRTDPRISYHYKNNLIEYKLTNKKVLTDSFHLNPNLPLITFIGRLVNEKGADLLPDVIHQAIRRGFNAAFVILGTGDKSLEQELKQLAWKYQSVFNCAIAYDETTAHQLYAGSDFILMPSRVEPCGLNQMYAMRYGTVPIVRSVGGLKDTVWDYGDWEGRGFRFQQFSTEDCLHAISRALTIYYQPDEFRRLQKHDMSLDFSWISACENYKKMYDSLT